MEYESESRLPSDLSRFTDLRVMQNSRGILSDTNHEGGVPVNIPKNVSAPKTTIINPNNSLNRGGLFLAADVPFSLIPTGGSKAPLAIQFTTLDNRIAPNTSMGANGKLGWIGARSGERYGT